MNTELPLWAFFTQKYSSSKEPTDTHFRQFIKESDKSLKVNTFIVLKDENIESEVNYTLHNLKTGKSKVYPSIDKLVIPESTGINFLAVNFPLPNTKRNNIIVRIPNDYASIVERFLQDNGDKK